MKNLRSCLFLVALVSLICVFIPGRAFAQDGGDDPCCYVAPSITSSFIAGDIQPLTPASNLAINTPMNRSAMPVIGQSVLAAIGKGTEMPIALEESWTPNYRQ